MRSRGAVPRPRREAGGDGPARDRASPHGHFFACYGGLDGRPGAPRSGGRAVRSRRASCTGYAIWPQQQGIGTIFPISYSLAVRFFGRCARRYTRRAQPRKRDRPACKRDARACLRGVGEYPLRDYAEAEVRLQELVALADETGASFWKTFGLTVQGWLFAVSGQA